MAENLWGDLPLDTEMRTPLVVLREQATVLGEITRQLLIGSVTSTTDPFNQFVHTLRIVAPALDGYEVSILRVSHPVDLYPLRVDNFMVQPERRFTCDDENEFRRALESILKSDGVHRLIAALIAQSKAVA